MTDACLPPLRSRLSRGFTLVELLVAIAVLAFIIIMIGQMVGGLSQAMTSNAKRLDATGQARLVFDRLGMDLAALPQRSDLGISFTKAPTPATSTNSSDSIAFYSTVTGYNGTRSLALVSYRIQQTTSGRLFQLERGAIGTNWTSSGFFQIPPPYPSLPTSNSDYDVLAPGVFRLAYRFLLKTGALSNTIPAAAQSGSLVNNDLSQVSGIVVALAALDNNSRLLLTTPSSQLPALAEAFTDGVATNEPVAAWNAALNQTGGLSIAGIPNQVVQNVCVYQRTFYIPFYVP
jgi:prepilin-type N-terminal cleavage/methylation domain-containing protein